MFKRELAGRFINQYESYMNKKLLFLSIIIGSVSVVHAMESTKPNMIRLMLADGHIDVLSRKQAEFCGTVKDYIEDCGVEQAMPVPIAYQDYVLFKPLLSSAQSKHELEELLGAYDKERLEKVLHVADYLNISLPIELAAKRLASLLIQKESLQAYINRPHYLKFLNQNIKFAVAKEFFHSSVMQYYYRAIAIQSRSLQGHANAVQCGIWSPDGAEIASASNDNTVRIWDAKTGACIHVLHEHSDQVNAVVWSPDGAKLASASNDNTVRIWDAKTGACIHVLYGHTEWVAAVAWSLDGGKLASASWDNTVCIWHVESGKRMKALHGHIHWVTAVAFSPDGSKLASASWDEMVRVWGVEVGDCMQVLRGHAHWVTKVIWLPEGRYLASSSVDKTIRIWDTQTGKCIQILRGHTDGVTDISCSLDGSKLASSSVDKTVRIWDAQTSKCMQILRGHTDMVRNVIWSPDDRYLASASHDGTIRMWDAQAGACLQVLCGHTDRITGISWSPDGTQLVSASNDTTLCVWNLKPLLQLLIHGISLEQALALHAVYADPLAKKAPHIEKALMLLPKELQYAL